MGNATSSDSLKEFEEELPDSEAIDSEHGSVHTEQHRSARVDSMSNKELSLLLHTYKDVFLRFRDLELVEKLSDGFFENVYRGFYGTITKTEVLVKIPVNQRFTLSKAKDLAKDLHRYVKLRHENIVQLVGYALSSEQLFVVSEFCHGSSMLNTLQKNNHLPLHRLAEWAIHIAKGMQYLQANHVVHGNLCAAVCLLNVSDVSTAMVKVTDFIHPSVFEFAFSVFPLRWCAPETIATGGGNTSLSGDVWSYGIVLWELFSAGKQPYPNIASNLILQEYLLHRNGVHERPDRMPQDFYDTVMAPCLNHSPGKRLSFEHIVALIEGLLPSLPDVYEKQLPSRTSSTNKGNTK